MTILPVVYHAFRFSNLFLSHVSFREARARYIERENEILLVYPLIFLQVIDVGSGISVVFSEMRA
jgi:hypothetical protein